MGFFFFRKRKTLEKEKHGENAETRSSQEHRTKRNEVHACSLCDVPEGHGI